MSFVVPKPPLEGEMTWVSGKKEEHPEDLLVFKAFSKGEEKNIEVKGGQYTTNSPVQFQMAGLNFQIELRSQRIKTSLFRSN